MSLTIKNMYKQQGISSPVVSVKNENALHYKMPSSIKQINHIFATKNKGDGYACGCRTKDSLKLEVFGKDIKKFGEVVPAWVAASKSGNSTRTIRGIITTSKISGTDFPLKPWHDSYDWNIFVKTDPQFFYLNSPVNKAFNKTNKTAIMECEWDSAHYPIWARPMPGDRVQITGRWIYDCGHPIKKENSNKKKHRSEIHPPKAVISFREETEQFYGNKKRSRANQAIVYLNERGGYINQKLSTQNYSFDLYLPPKPSAASAPKYKIYLSERNKHILPIIKPYPLDNPKLLRVTIPLKGNKSIKEYGAKISGGWSDFESRDARDIKKVTVFVKELNLKKQKDTALLLYREPNEWYIHLGINGRWRTFKSLDKGKHPLKKKYVFYLHKSQNLKISVNGYEADQIDDIMGKSVGLHPKVAFSSGLNKKEREYAAKKIIDGFLSIGLKNLLEGEQIENDKIGRIDFSISSTKRLSNKIFKSDRDDYEIKVDIK